ncbi:hypothetical protein M2251_000273 [Rhodococcus erythropolis]|nr:hypothetical protein [Rhodococcus erythropolis]
MKTSRPSPGCGGATVSPRDHDCRQPPHARRDSSPRNNDRNPIDERRLLPNPVPRMRPPRLRRTLDPTARASPPARAAPRTLHECASHNDRSHRGERRARAVVPPAHRTSTTQTAIIPIVREKHAATTNAITQRTTTTGARPGLTSPPTGTRRAPRPPNTQARGPSAGFPEEVKTGGRRAQIESRRTL